MKLPNLTGKKAVPEEEARKILRRAKRRARKIVQEAEREAQLKLADVEALKTQIQNEFRQQLKKAADEVAVSLTEKALIEINKFNEGLKAKVLASQEAEKALIAQDFDEVRKEVEAYKKEQLSQIDKRVAATIKEVTKKFLGEALDESQHTKLIVEAIEDAKRRNLL